MKQSMMSVVLATTFLFAANNVVAEETLSAASTTTVPTQNNKKPDTENQAAPLVAILPRKLEIPGMRGKNGEPISCQATEQRDQGKLQERFNHGKLQAQKHLQRGFVQRQHGRDNRR